MYTFSSTQILRVTQSHCPQTLTVTSAHMKVVTGTQVAIYSSCGVLATQASKKRWVAKKKNLFSWKEIICGLL